MLPKPMLLSRAQIDAPSWDDHIQQSHQSVIYALSGYLDIVCPDWQALVWPNASDFQIVMPLPVKHKFGHRIVYQPLFCQYLGIFSKTALRADECEAFLNELAGFRYISAYSFCPENFPILVGLDRVRQFQWKTLETHWLDLSQSYSQLSAGYSKDRNANLKRGLKTQWRSQESSDFGPLIRLFKAHHANRIDRVKPEAYQLLTQLGMHWLEKGAATLTYAGHSAEVNAGILLLHLNGRGIYLFNAADAFGRKHNARSVMLDQWFHQHAGKIRSFDFESPDVPPICKHYRSFGTTPVPFYQLSRNALPLPLRLMQQLRKWLFKTRRYLYANLYRILNPSQANRF